MMKTKDTPSKTTQEVELLGEERQRLGRVEAAGIERLGIDLIAGQVIFRGTLEGAPTGTIAQAAQKLMTERIAVIYDRLDQFAAPVTTKDVTDALAHPTIWRLSAPSLATESGIGVVHRTPEGYQIATDAGAIDDLMKVVNNEISYGHLVTGGALATKLGEPARGATIEVAQALCAAALRQRLHLRRRIKVQRLEPPLTTGWTASSATYRLSRHVVCTPTAGPSVETRS